MRKKIRLAQDKDDLHDLGQDDLLSRLSDDILVSILSYLPLKDVVATSNLSRRWRYLWCQTVCLEFEFRDRSKKLIDLADRNKYINRVNRIIRQHKSPRIDEFKICFGLDKNAKGAIGKWIEFAISKNVRTLELDLKAKPNGLSNYVFPTKIFDRKCGSSSKRPSFNVPVRPYMEINFLKALILKGVDVSDEGLKKILSNCSVLEYLSIHDSRELVKPKIHGKELALKNLDLKFSDRLESIEICDSNVVFISCRRSNSGDGPITLRLDKLQKLEKICVGDTYSWNKINDMFCQLSSCIPYLQILELDLYRLQGAIEFPPFPKLLKLKQLIMNVGVRDDDSLLVLTSLVEASPNLELFKIELMWYCWMRPRNRNREVRQVAKQSHLHLKVVEIFGYYGLPGDLELAMYFIENGVALKKLVIQPFMKMARLGTHEVMEVNGAIYNAHQQLEPRTPTGVELVIL